MTQLQKTVGALIIAVPGVWFCVQVDWRIALGVFLMLWGNNLGKSE